MTERVHDWATYEDPVFCRNCGKRKLDAYAAEGGFIKCVGGFRYGVKEGELDGSIARDLRQIKAQEGRSSFAADPVPMCPAPFLGDAGTVEDCCNKGHCGCSGPALEGRA